MVEYLNQVWLVGGEVDLDQSNSESLDTVVIFDPVSDSQITSRVKMNVGRDSAGAVVGSEDRLFVFGGQNDSLYELSSVEMYSPRTNEFTLVAPMKIKRWDLGACRVGNLVYVMGGEVFEYDDESGDHEYGLTDSVEIYNMDTDEWSGGVDLPESCIKVSAFATDGTYMMSSKKVCLSFLFFYIFCQNIFLILLVLLGYLKYFL